MRTCDVSARDVTPRLGCPLLAWCNRLGRPHSYYCTGCFMMHGAIMFLPTQTTLHVYAQYCKTIQRAHSGFIRLLKYTSFLQKFWEVKLSLQILRILCFQHIHSLLSLDSQSLKVRYPRELCFVLTRISTKLNIQTTLCLPVKSTRCQINSAPKELAVIFSSITHCSFNTYLRGKENCLIPQPLGIKTLFLDAFVFKMCFKCTGLTCLSTNR